MLTPTSVFYFCGVPPLINSTYQNLVEFFEVIVSYDIEILSRVANRKIAIVEHCPNRFDGLHAVKKIRSIDENIPVIFLAKEPSKITIINAIRLGASDVFMVPVVKEDLISCIYQLMEKNKNSLWKKYANKLLEFGNRFFKNGSNFPKKSGYSKDIMYSSILFPIPIPDLKKEKETLKLIQVKSLDDFEIRFNDKLLTSMKSKRAMALLNYLFFHKNKTISKHVLMNAFWGSSNSESAKNCLHVTIHHLRKYLAEEIPDEPIILFKNDKYSISPEIEIQMDSDLFIENWKKGKYIEEFDGLEKALEYYQKAYMIYQKDFLENIAQENWIEIERDNLREIFLSILGKLSLYYFQQGKYMVALQVSKEALKKDNCLEEVHRRIMACYFSLKMRDKAIRHFYKCAKILNEELEIEPSKATLELFKKISKN